MSNWAKDELRKIAGTDDLHISPFAMTERHTALRRGSGRLYWMRRSMFAPITARTHVGIRQRCAKKRDESLLPA